MNEGYDDLNLLDDDISYAPDTPNYDINPSLDINDLFDESKEIEEKKGIKSLISKRITKNNKEMNIKSIPRKESKKSTKKILPKKTESEIDEFLDRNQPFNLDIPKELELTPEEKRIIEEEINEKNRIKENRELFEKRKQIFKDKKEKQNEELMKMIEGVTKEDVDREIAKMRGKKYQKPIMVPKAGSAIKYKQIKMIDKKKYVNDNKTRKRLYGSLKHLKSEDLVDLGLKEVIPEINLDFKIPKNPFGGKIKFADFVRSKDNTFKGVVVGFKKNEGIVVSDVGRSGKEIVRKTFKPDEIEKIPKDIRKKITLPNDINSTNVLLSTDINKTIRKIATEYLYEYLLKVIILKEDKVELNVVEFTDEIEKEERISFADYLNLEFSRYLYDRNLNEYKKEIFKEIDKIEEEILQKDDKLLLDLYKKKNERLFSKDVNLLDISSLKNKKELSYLDKEILSKINFDSNNVIEGIINASLNKLIELDFLRRFDDYISLRKFVNDNVSQAKLKLDKIKETNDFNIIDSVLLQIINEKYSNMNIDVNKIINEMITENIVKPKVDEFLRENPTILINDVNEIINNLLGVSNNQEYEDYISQNANIIEKGSLKEALLNELLNLKKNNVNSVDVVKVLYHIIGSVEGKALFEYLYNKYPALKTNDVSVILKELNDAKDRSPFEEELLTFLTNTIKGSNQELMKLIEYAVYRSRGQELIDILYKTNPELFQSKTTYKQAIKKLNKENPFHSLLIQNLNKYKDVKKAIDETMNEWNGYEVYSLLKNNYGFLFDNGLSLKQKLDKYIESNSKGLNEKQKQEFIKNDVLIQKMKEFDVSSILRTIIDNVIDNFTIQKHLTELNNKYPYLFSNKFNADELSNKLLKEKDKDILAVKVYQHLAKLNKLDKDVLNTIVNAIKAYELTREPFDANKYRERRVQEELRKVHKNYKPTEKDVETFTKNNKDILVAKYKNRYGNIVEKSENKDLRKEIKKVEKKENRYTSQSLLKAVKENENEIYKISKKEGYNINEYLSFLLQPVIFIDSNTDFGIKSKWFKDKLMSDKYNIAHLYLANLAHFFPELASSFEGNPVEEIGSETKIYNEKLLETAEEFFKAMDILIDIHSRRVAISYLLYIQPSTKEQIPVIPNLNYLKWDILTNLNEICNTDDLGDMILCYDADTDTFSCHSLQEAYDDIKNNRLNPITEREYPEEFIKEIKRRMK